MTSCGPQIEPPAGERTLPGRPGPQIGLCRQAVRVYGLTRPLSARKADSRVKPAPASSAPAVSTLLAAIAAALALGAVASYARTPLRPDPAPHSSSGSLQPDASPGRAVAPSVRLSPSAVPERTIVPSTPAPAVTHVARRPARHHARRHRRIAAHRARPVGLPSLSRAPAPLPAPAAVTSSENGHLLLAAASVLLLIVVLGASFFALTLGQVRSARP
jgi:hypothetical protein